MTKLFTKQLNCTLFDTPPNQCHVTIMVHELGLYGQSCNLIAIQILPDIRARFLSPILKPESLAVLPTSHLTVFYIHSKWFGSQVTWRNPKWLRLLTWRYRSVTDLVVLTSLFVFCIFLNQYMWQYMICFITYLQTAVRILFIDI